MALGPGARVGGYAIVGALGAGGMGEVYRGRDANLHRDVAIKILPDAFAADADRTARFEREARVLASLNHPNIAAIYGLERSGGTAFLIMELAEGETLAARRARGPIAIDDAIAMALQIASALETAHDKGVVHRDLKPANVVVSANGTIKVLDFGLAKLANPDPASHPDVSASPTLAHAGTMAGVILGTAAYMSPEQARGRTVDKRADIWAFGCVLYEMLTGIQAFAGDTLTDIVAAVVKNEPDWSRLPADTPPAARSVLRRCLKKDPNDRLHDIADARIELQDPVAPAPAIAAPPRGERTTVIAWSVAAVAIALAMYFGVRDRTKPSASGPMLARLELSPPAGVELFNAGVQNLAVSPDGRRVAFVGTLGGVRQVYLRAIDQFEAAPIRGTDGAFSCFFSWTGDAVGFIGTNRSLKTVSIADGLVHTLTAAEADFNSGSAWSPDNRITFGRGEALWQIPATGGTPTVLTTLDRGGGEAAHVFPAAVGDRAILFTTLLSNGGARIEAVRLASGKRHTIVESGTFPMHGPDGTLVFFRDGVLLAAPFDESQLAVTGPPIRVVESLGTGPSSGPLAALSRSGVLLYATTATSASRLVWVTRQGAQEPVTDLRRLYFGPHLSPDGKQIAVQASGDLWTYAMDRATFTKLTSQSTFGNSFPTWTPDSKRVILRTNTGLYSMAVDGSGKAEPIPSTTISDFPNSVSPDGATLLVNRQTATLSQDVYAVSLRGGEPPKPVISTPAFEGGGNFSADGRWMTYVSDEAGQMQVYIRPYPGLDKRWQVSTEGGTSPVWSRNGRELFYRNGNKMMAVDLVEAGNDLRLSPPRMLFDQSFAYGQTITMPNYDISADGQRFLMIRDEPGSSRLNIIMNWTEELRRLGAARK